MKEVLLDPVFLTIEDIQEKPLTTLNGKYDSRCIVCLEPCYRLWIGDDPPPAGCMCGHTDKTKCTEHAVPAAKMHAVGRYIKSIDNTKGKKR